ncbi:heavy-metal-associated domain-containing protein [Qipengyuania sp.]|uniref:heavy-metal-associated domain-containing protein n=1 Tax=Qipengyuania sp. TaxID=2004515 RepID=UPI0035C7F216
MRTLSLSSLNLSCRQFALVAVGTVAALLVAIAAIGQIAGERGIAPVAASRDITVSGVEVDVKGDNEEEAREAGWKEATRKAWEKIKGPKLSDSQLAGLVSAIVIESEQLGPKRYVARLGVVFDRTRASGYLGAGGEVARSAPLLLIPITYTGGVATVFERRNPWQRAWAEFQPGGSRIDYVRPVGSGADSLLITAGQAGRRSRLWWRTVLDRFGASDVLMAVVRLEYAYPGGPVTGHFTARHGPDSEWLGEFTLRAPNSDALPAMLSQAVERFDALYTRALNAGVLSPDPTLNIEIPELSPEVQALIAQGRAAAAERAAEARQAEAARNAAQASPTPSPTPGAGTPTASPAAIGTFTVQFPTPDPASVDAALAAVRGADGVRGAATSSLALGGTSVMRVTFAGSQAELVQALRARGFTVREAGGGLAISR